MASSWTSPNAISQSGELETHISWKSNFSSVQYDDGSRLSTTTPLSHIANSYAGDRLMKTYYLYATGFNFRGWDYNNNIIAGIQLKLKSERSGRIVDDTVQLILNGSVIGNNVASTTIDQTKYYGISPHWEVVVNNTSTNLIVQDPTFGVCIRFQSHPNWPHRESPAIEYIALKLLTAADVALATDDGKNIDEDGKTPNVGSSRDGRLNPGNPLDGGSGGRDPGPGDIFETPPPGSSFTGSTGFSGSTGYISSTAPSYGIYVGSSGSIVFYITGSNRLSGISGQQIGDIYSSTGDSLYYVWNGTSWNTYSAFTRIN